MASEGEEQQEKPKSSSKLLIIIVVAVVLLAGGGAGAYFKFFRASGGGEAANAGAGGEHKAEGGKHGEMVIQDMDTFLVNLADEGGKRFLKVTMKARLDGPSLGEEFKSRTFEMRDLILMILTSKTVDEITTPEDKQALKKEIVASLNRSLHKGQVQDLYFTEFLIQ